MDSTEKPTHRQSFVRLGRFFVLLFVIASASVLPSWSLAEIATKDKQSFQRIEAIEDDLRRYAIPPWALLKIPEFQNLYRNALNSGSDDWEPWIRNLDVVSRPGIALSDGKSVVFYYLGSKPHEGEKNIVITFDPRQSRVGIRLVEYITAQSEYKTVRTLGNPTPFMKKLMAASPKDVLARLPR